MLTLIVILLLAIIAVTLLGSSSSWPAYPFIGNRLVLLILIIVLTLLAAFALFDPALLPAHMVR